ncbi:hypothetical protein ACHAWF_014878 [Thalassiosira exigua]
MMMNYIEMNQKPLPNEERPALAAMGASRYVRTTVRTKLGPTEPKAEFDLKHASIEDLEPLRKRDPFLYYSIPGVRRDAMLLKPVDASSLAPPKSNRNDRGAWRPARLGSEADATPPSQKVWRRSCISFECHPDMLLEDLEESGLDEDPLELLIEHVEGQYQRR